MISKKRIKIQEHVIESVESYPVIFFRGGCTSDERCEVWPVRPTGAPVPFLVLRDDTKTLVAL